MKRKEIIQLLLIAVVTMMVTACAASRRAVSDNHQEVKDSVSAIQQDSVHQQVMVNDSAAIKVSEDKYTSSSSTETGEYEETIEENITETTDSSGNKQKTTHRTTHRKGSYNCQSSYDERLQMQQQKINQMQKTIDSLAVSSRNDVGTHWEATDSLLATEEENTAETRKANWIQKARKNALALFLLIVIVLVFTAINKYTDHGEGKKETK